jgi:uncharacterized membrane protein
MKKFTKYFTNPLIFSLVGNIAMIIARIIYANDFYYSFLLWNLFLAGIPLFISHIIIRFKIEKLIVLGGMLYIWLLFLPNAPYIVTDMVHLYQRPPVPFWYDMFLVLLSAVNGLILCFISIGQIENILKKYQKSLNLNIFRVILIIAMSYGVYVGRYLRFNSWDAIISPIEVGRGMIHSVHAGMVGFVITFAFINLVLYSFFRSILPYRSQEAA